MRFLRDDLERRIVRLAIPALGTLAVERWLGRRAVYNLLGTYRWPWPPFCSRRSAWPASGEHS